MAKFTQNEVWDDTLRLIRTHWVALVAIAGVFNFFPVLLVNHYVPWPEPGPDVEAGRALAIMGAFLRQNIIWFVLQSFVIMIGSAAMLRLVFARGVTVGGALVFGAMLLPVYSLMLVFINLGVLIGLVLLIVPGLYVWGRLFPAGAVMVAEDRRHPIETIRRSWALTEGHGWLILGLYILVALSGAVLLFAVEKLTGIVFILAAGQELGRFLTEIVLALLTAAVATLVTMLSAAVYRAVAPRKPEL
ncbi:MAG TPA: hypothetical protein VMG08_15610 [Allosphingosinicella sp.]|nr:hypothetical protein [Allosphingosinicella sp.]